MKSKMVMRIKVLLRTGFFDIFGATVLNSMISFVYGIFLIRILSKTDYGTFSYAQNALNFGFMFCTLGGNIGIIQFCSEKNQVKTKYAYSKFAIKMGIFGSILVACAMMIYAKVDNSEVKNLMLYITEFSALPFFYFVKEWIVANLRWQLKNRQYGIVMNVHSALNAVFAIVGAYFGGIQGTILGIYLAYIGVALLGLYFLKDSVINKLPLAEKLEKIEKQKFMNYAFTMCVVNAMISVLFTIDLFIIGNIVKDADQIAMYKTASVIPFALNMIPNAVMIFVYPHIAMHKHEAEWMKKNIKVLYLTNGVLNIFIGTVLIILAPLLTEIFFGNEYIECTNIFRILIVSYILSSTLRTPSANILAILKLTKTAFAISAGTVIISIFLGIVLVSKYGIVGAAYGSVGTFGIVGFVSFSSIFLYIRKKSESNLDKN